MKIKRIFIPTFILVLFFSIILCMYINSYNTTNDNDEVKAFMRNLKIIKLERSKCYVSKV